MRRYVEAGDAGAVCSGCASFRDSVSEAGFGAQGTGEYGLSLLVGMVSCACEKRLLPLKEGR